MFKELPFAFADVAVEVLRARRLFAYRCALISLLPVPADAVAPGAFAWAYADVLLWLLAEVCAVVEIPSASTINAKIP